MYQPSVVREKSKNKNKLQLSTKKTITYL